MNAVTDIERAEVELVDDSAKFFAPVSSDVLDGLLGEYQQRRSQIDQLAALVHGDLGNVVHYFIGGNAGNEQVHRSIYVDKLFEVPGAVHALDSAYWSKALALTDVYECMPQNRKNEWNDQLRHPEGKKAGRWDSKGDVAPLPHFEEATVRQTIESLLVMRSQFLAEKVDGIFRALSGTHVTNAPEAFGKRMIIAHVLSEYHTTDHRRVGYLHDLRCVIAKFMGRDEPKHSGATDALVMAARHRFGEWVTADGGALRIRVYKVGTAHLEVHPNMAWRLNQILAHLYPMAIPAQFRERPKRQPKNVAPIGRPLPFAVLEVLAGVKQATERCGKGWPERYTNVPDTYTMYAYDTPQQVKAEAEQVLRSLGGTLHANKAWWVFDYPVGEVIAEVVNSGCVPDKQAHQFYPTPAKLARICAELADVQPGESVLEPSAGQGDLAQALPHVTACVEVSPLHCAVLRARGYSVDQADFLNWAPPTAYDAIVMNPPFADGRARAHLEHASLMVKPGGRLVAILPASAKGKDWLGDGFSNEWNGPFEQEFAGTSVSVVILKAVHA